MIDLYEHNQQAYERVMQAFQTRNKCAVVHATGTGKSLIAASVIEHFGKVLVLAPNNFVLNETRKWCRDGVEFCTYASNMYYQGIGYDLIVIDEFHRAGAIGYTIYIVECESMLLVRERGRLSSLKNKREK